MNTLGIKLYFSDNNDNDDDDDDYCQTDKTLNIGNIPEMLLCCQKKANQAWETSPQATLISLWLCGKLACPDLCCDRS